VQVVSEAAELAGSRLSDGADVVEFSDREDDLKVDLEFRLGSAGSDNHAGAFSTAPDQHIAARQFQRCLVTVGGPVVAGCGVVDLGYGMAEQFGWRRGAQRGHDLADSLCSGLSG